MLLVPAAAAWTGDDYLELLRQGEHEAGRRTGSRSLSSARAHRALHLSVLRLPGGFCNCVLQLRVSRRAQLCVPTPQRPHRQRQYIRLRRFHTAMGASGAALLCRRLAQGQGWAAAALAERTTYRPKSPVYFPIYFLPDYMTGTTRLATPMDAGSNGSSPSGGFGGEPGGAPDGSPLAVRPSASPACGVAPSVGGLRIS